MIRIHQVFLMAAFVLVCGPPAAWSDVVVPSDRVTSHVIVRESASGSSLAIGQLAPGESALLITSVPHYHKVRLADGKEGFVSKSWTRVIHNAQVPHFEVHFLDVGTGDS